MLPWKLRKCQILPVNQNLSSVYFSYAKFQLVSCDPSLAIIWQTTYTHKLPKLCSATLSPWTKPLYQSTLTRYYLFSGKNFRITPYINYAFCVINYASPLLSFKTMANSPEYCIYTLVINTYCVNKRGFQFLSFFSSFSTPLFLFFPSHSPTTLSSPPGFLFPFFSR